MTEGIIEYLAHLVTVTLAMQCGIWIERRKTPKAKPLHIIDARPELDDFSQGEEVYLTVNGRRIPCRVELKTTLVLVLREL